MIRALSPRRFTELAFAIVAIVALVPFDPVLASTGLDPSWQQALHHAIERGLQFGTDIVFTYGPLGFAHTRVYWPGLFAVTLLYWLAFAVALAHAAIALTRTAGARPWICLLYTSPSPRDS